MFNGVCGCNACYLLMKSERYNATLFTTIFNRIKIKQNSFLLIHPDFTDVEHQFSSLILVSICISYFIVKHHDSGNLYKTGFIWNCGLSTQISNGKWNWIAECHETLKANSSNILLPMRPCLLNLLNIPSPGDCMLKSWDYGKKLIQAIITPPFRFCLHKLDCCRLYTKCEQRVCVGLAQGLYSLSTHHCCCKWKNDPCPLAPPPCLLFFFLWWDLTL